MRFFKIILINATVFCSLFLSIELSYRVWLYFRNYDKSYHTAYLTELNAFDTHTRVYEFMAPDLITGFSPGNDGTFVIRAPGWNEATITIRQGVRVNANFAPTSTGDAILAVGDSFVFGDQVSDDETWPSILEHRLSRRVVNGGVSGYGTTQAVLRAEHLLKAQPYSLVILSILVNADLERDRSVNNNRPAVIREDGRLRQTSVEESRRILSENFVCGHRIPELFFWSHIAKRFYDMRCTSIIHPNAATLYEILTFAIERLAVLPANKAILLQYPRFSFEGTGEGTVIDEARMIRDAANRYGVPVIDTYSALKNKPLCEIYICSEWWPHHSKKGNEIVADLIAREIAMLPRH